MEHQFHPLLDLIFDASHPRFSVWILAKERGIDRRQPSRRLIDMILADNSAAKGGPDLKRPPLAHAPAPSAPLAALGPGEQNENVRPESQFASVEVWYMVHCTPTANPRYPAHTDCRFSPASTIP